MSRPKALLFDVFGTVVNWHASVIAELERHTQQTKLTDIDWQHFAEEWRRGYMHLTRHVANGGDGPSDIDDMHRQLLDELLERDEYGPIARVWTETDKSHINLVWHRLHGWPDSSQAIRQLHDHAILATLSNGSTRLLVDLARFADLHWDAIFASDMLKTYKPNPKMYLGACKLLGLQPSEVGMVAAHIYDLQFASKHGLRTYYIRRATEDVGVPEGGNAVKTKQDGGEVDYVFNDLQELADHFASS
ncbi:uncharacterized protein L969DRAFT_54954 [Mixia osmundae IAM 14324]|uniref:Haloacid dehalogenase n=1 Tax=Mixia osmundae (strain CBS 9802 / IAM 14324 / JCM 22182 / KY 12970) TaxID=764103 RepID=G7DW93_MIXOS|nr:uncharacterized protein L969DRAFT_54954 [Mixia osmundae IAM 14324]KEI36520.1 hypothetical protein L969DRAFT_54954 [Mixia osmundae IAM 14324]GAA94781.1 hypothetical protein E5Q_01435 [Mixia osmundae IAM 14324]